MEETISLKDIFEVIRKRAALILTAMFVGLGLAAVMTFMVITPKYSSSSQLLVTLPSSSENGMSNVNDVNFNLQMIATYKQLITSSTVVAESTQQILAAEHNYKGSPADIQGMIEVLQEQNSQMFSIKATTTDPVIAQAAASTIADVFKVEAQRLLPQVEEVSIIADAPLNTKPVSPNNKLNLLIGLILGLMIGVGMAFLIDILDKTVKDDKFIKEDLEFSILGTVPQMSEKELNARMAVMPAARPANLPGTAQQDDALTRRSRTRV